MKQLLNLMLFVFALACGQASANDPAKYRSVAFDDFMQQSVEPGISISIPVPIEYEALDIDQAPNDYSYWMRESDARRSIRTGDLPDRRGYMYGKVSVDVGYDKERDFFVGLEDAASLDVFRAQMTLLKIERFDHPKHPVVLLSFADPDSGHLAYGMYVATGIDSDVVYIALRPEKNSREVGEFIWGVLRRTLMKSNYKLQADHAAFGGIALP